MDKLEQLKERRMFTYVRRNVLSRALRAAYLLLDSTGNGIRSDEPSCGDLKTLVYPQVDKLEQLKERMLQVRGIFRDTEATEFVIVTIPTVSRAPFHTATCPLFAWPRDLLHVAPLLVERFLQDALGGVI